MSVEAGQRLRDLRGDVGVREFAAATGLSSGYISLLETGQRSPILSHVPRVAAAYGLTPVEFCALWFDETPGQWDKHSPQGDK